MCARDDIMMVAPKKLQYPVVLEQCIKMMLEQLDMRDISGGPEGVMSGGKGSIARLRAVFLEPFTDVVKTAMMGAEKTTNVANRAVFIAIEKLRRIIVPWAMRDFSDVIIRGARERARAIDARYGDVLKRTNNALYKGDAVGLAFLANPSFFIASALVGGNIKAVAWLIKTLLDNDAIEEYTRNAISDQRMHNAIAAKSGGLAGILGYIFARRGADNKHQRAVLINTIDAGTVKMRSDASDALMSLSDEYLKRAKKALSSKTAHELLNAVDRSIIDQLIKSGDIEEDALIDSITKPLMLAVQRAYITPIHMLANDVTLPSNVRNVYSALVKSIAAIRV